MYLYIFKRLKIFHVYKEIIKKKKYYFYFSAHDVVQHGWTPITTTTSVLGVVFDSGVAIAADTLTSYGSMACFQNNPRILTV